MSESETKSHFLIVMMFNFSSMVANFRFNYFRCSFTGITYFYSSRKCDVTVCWQF
jgi:hypothetical protein